MKIFNGKTRILFEREPYYLGRDRLDRVIINLGFTKLVRRITPESYTKELLNEMRKRCPRIEEISTAMPSLTGSNTKGFSRLYAYTESGELIGSIEDLAWIIKRDLKLDPYYKGVAFNKETNTFYGFSHRGGTSFKIGDQLYTEKDHKELYEINRRLGEKTPYNQIGKRTITTLTEARQAAYNLSKSLS